MAYDAADLGDRPQACVREEPANLGEGVAASTRQDGQAKRMGEWLRARHVDVPVALLEDGG